MDNLGRNGFIFQGSNGGQSMVPVRYDESIVLVPAEEEASNVPVKTRIAFESVKFYRFEGPAQAFVFNFNSAFSGGDRPEILASLLYSYTGMPGLLVVRLHEGSSRGGLLLGGIPCPWHRHSNRGETGQGGRIRGGSKQGFSGA
jgi:hypothetical protein